MGKRLLIAIVASFPVALVAGISMSFLFGSSDVAGAVSQITYWVVWVGVAIYAVREQEPSRVFGRTAIGYAVSAFSLIVSGIVMFQHLIGAIEGTLESSAADGDAVEAFATFIVGAGILSAFGPVFAVIVPAFGVITGLIGVLLAYLTLRTRDSESV